MKQRKCSWIYLQFSLVSFILFMHLHLSCNISPISDWKRLFLFFNLNFLKGACLSAIELHVFIKSLGQGSGIYHCKPNKYICSEKCFFCRWCMVWIIVTLWHRCMPFDSGHWSGEKTTARFTPIRLNIMKTCLTLFWSPFCCQNSPNPWRHGLH